MDFFVEFSIFLKRQVIFKNEKILLILSFMFFSANSYAIASQEIPGETFSYLFDFHTVLGIDNQNAAAASLYVNVSESVYKKTMVNARTNGLTVTSYANPAETSQTDGLMMVKVLEWMPMRRAGSLLTDSIHFIKAGSRISTP